MLCPSFNVLCCDCRPSWDYYMPNRELCKEEKRQRVGRFRNEGWGLDWRLNLERDLSWHSRQWLESSVSWRWGSNIDSGMLYSGPTIVRPILDWQMASGEVCSCLLVPVSTCQPFSPVCTQSENGKKYCLAFYHKYCYLNCQSSNWGLMCSGYKRNETQCCL